MSPRGMGVAFSVALFVGIAATGVSADFQSAPNPSLPNSVKLSEVEIRLTHKAYGGGCGVPRCIEYNVRVTGNGVVEYEDIGGEPRQPFQRRKVPVEQVVALVDAFVRARFFEANARYIGNPVASQEGDAIRFGQSGGADGPESDLTLRLGNQMKTVHLSMGFPDELGRLRDLVDKMGGPGAWPQKLRARLRVPETAPD